jgi:octaprenyl-diphosphate synthase
MKQIDQIKNPVVNELKEFNKVFSAAMKSSIPLVNLVTNYILRRKGKQIRPLLIFLTAKLVGEISESTYHAAALAELLHTATLVHDDVVDESYQRRGFLSISAIWKSKIAVLFGDFLLSRGLILAVENKEYDILDIFTRAVKEMSEGELYQIQKSRKLNITENEYYDIIHKKTATLLAACTASGARSVTQDQAVIDKMREFGINIGMAFQIKDDLFDYEKDISCRETQRK